MEANPEQLLIARMLHADPADFHYLERITPAELKPLRAHLEDRLGRVGESGVSRLAGASAAVPAALCATVAQRVLGPMICALLALRVDQDKALRIIGHLDPPFLARVAGHLPADRASDLVDALPLELLRAVMRELDRQGEQLVIASLVAALPGAVADALIGELADEAIAEILLLSAEPETLVRQAGPAVRHRLRQSMPGLPTALRERLAPLLQTPATHGKAAGSHP